MNEKEIKELKLLIAERTEAGLQQCVGLPLTPAVTASIKGYMETTLKDLLAITRWRILELIEIDIQMEQNNVHVALKPKFTLDDMDYVRAVAFICNKEFW